MLYTACTYTMYICIHAKTIITEALSPFSHRDETNNILPGVYWVRASTVPVQTTSLDFALWTVLPHPQSCLLTLVQTCCTVNAQFGKHSWYNSSQRIISISWSTSTEHIFHFTPYIHSHCFAAVTHTLRQTNSRDVREDNRLTRNWY